MSITILSKPYDGLGTLPKINPVYNGLGFAVSSNNNKAPNFRYIAEVFINGAKVGQLSHNPDISSGNIGIFDIGRIVENYLSYNLNWNIKVPTVAPNSLVGYHIEFGEEFSRIGTVKNVQASFGNVRIETTTPHGLETGDRVQVQASTYGPYNGFFVVSYITPTAFRINCTFNTSNVGSSMYFVSGELVSSFLSYMGADGKQYVRLKTKANTTFQTGNIINIAMDAFASSSWLSSYQNIDWTVVKTTSYTSYSYVDTNIPFQTTVLSWYSGSVVSRGNFFKRNLLSTKNDLAKAFNGVEQYETWTDWTPYPYIFTRSEFAPVLDPYGQLGRFLTKRPRTNIKVCYSDYMVLSEFGKNNFYNTPATAMNTWYIIETLSTPAPPAMPTEIAGNIKTYFRLSGGTNAGKQALLKEWTAGSYLTLFGWYWNGSAYVAIHTNCYIAQVEQTGNDLLLYLVHGYGGGPEQWFITATGTYVFSGYQASMVMDPTHQWNATMKTRIAYNKVGPTVERNEGPAGPKNLEAYYEFSNKRCYQYRIYHVKVVYDQQWYNYEKFSEIMTFDLDCKCSKFKKYTLMWLNDLGGWDFYYFNLKSDIEREIERSQFHKHLKSYSTGNGYRYNGGDRGRTTYNTTSNDNYTVRSEYLTQGELDWMANLLESPEVYWIKNTTKNDTVAGVWTNNIPVDKLIPVNITNSKFELFNKTNTNKDTGSLYIYELTFQAALNRGVQRGGATTLPVSGATTPGVVNPGVDPNGPWSPAYDDWRTSRNNWDYFYNRS